MTTPDPKQFDEASILKMIEGTVLRILEKHMGKSTESTPPPAAPPADELPNDQDSLFALIHPRQAPAPFQVEGREERWLAEKGKQGKKYSEIDVEE